MSHRRFVAISAIVIAMVLFLLALFVPTSALVNTVSTSSAEGAKNALTLLKDATIWMAGIQTATITALGFLAKDGLTTFRPHPFVAKLALLSAMLNTLALFFSAWVLNAIPSITLRVYEKSPASVDFFNYPLYAYMGQTKVLTLGFFSLVNHTLWMAGILTFGLLSMAVFITRSQATLPPASTPA